MHSLKLVHYLGGTGTHVREFTPATATGRSKSPGWNSHCCVAAASNKPRGDRIVSVRWTGTDGNKKKHRHRQNITITIVIDSTIIDADRFISPVELAG